MYYTPNLSSSTGSPLDPRTPPKQFAWGGFQVLRTGLSRNVSIPFRLITLPPSAIPEGLKSHSGIARLVAKQSLAYNRPFGSVYCVAEPAGKLQ
jgi:hypothetical protein